MPRSLASALAALTLLTTLPAAAADAVAADQLPEPVIEKLRKSFADARILSAESETRNDYIYYFVKIRRGDHEQIVTINEYGAISGTVDAPNGKATATP